MSVSESDGGRDDLFDIDETIERVLLEKPRTASELRDAVIEKTGTNDRTYYNHLKKLLKLGAVEDLERVDEGRLLKKYAWRNVQLSIESFHGSGELNCSLSRGLSELAAWIKKEPEGWREFRRVAQARECLKRYPSLVPNIVPSCEDPDSYAFEWPDEAVRELSLDGRVSSRFFGLKLVYDSVEPDSIEDLSGSCKVTVGACCVPVVVDRIPIYPECMTRLRFVGQPIAYRLVEEPESVCIALCIRDAGFRVVYVETRKGKLVKTWVKGVAEHYRAKRISMSSYDSLKNGLDRKFLLKLRKVLEQRKLSIPNRYTKLVEELFDYSYNKPSNGYVLSLSLALDSA